MFPFFSIRVMNILEDLTPTGWGGCLYKSVEGSLGHSQNFSVSVGLTEAPAEKPCQRNENMQTSKRKNPSYALFFNRNHKPYLSS